MEQVGIDKNWEQNYAYQVKTNVNPELYKNGLEPHPVTENLEHWVNNEVAMAKTQSMRFLSEMYFHRRELRAKYVDNSYFFTPADGVLTNVHEKVDANAPLIEVKGETYTLADLLQDEDLEGDWLVAVVFMTFYNDHHLAQVYSSMRQWEDLPPLQTYNLPMLAMEKELMRGVVNPAFEGNYLKKNSRRIYTHYNSQIDTEFYTIAIGDLDVDTTVDFQQTDGETPMFIKQGTITGKIQYGSSSVLAIPLREGKQKFQLTKHAKIGNVVKTNITPLVKVLWGETYAIGEVQKVEEEDYDE